MAQAFLGDNRAEAFGDGAAATDAQHVWEVWVYQVFYGLFVCPWYSYSQIMISEVTPRGHEFLFFSLFSIIGKTSSFIGPLVSSAIIDATPDGHNSAPFYFLFGLSLLSLLSLWIFIDLKKSKREQDFFLEKKEMKKEMRRRSVVEGREGGGSDSSEVNEVKV